ncbi:MAG: HIT family protein [Gammaproteobacteria bacterium]|nr:HIT family protein [Gammaproteobacteria bacterium]
MTYDENNIFAKIIRGEAPAHIVEQDDACLTMMDIMPQSPGHTLVIPKEPAIDVFEVSDRGLEQVILQTRRVARAIDRVFEPDGVMLVQLNRSGAGQSVFHLHFHVIPRWGGLQMAFHSRDVEKSEILTEHASKIRSALAEIV